MTRGQEAVYAGSWDKSIYCWSTTGNTSQAAKRLTGHRDFVKALLSITLDRTELLVSASSDSYIIVWDVKSGAKLHILKGHGRGVTALALETLSSENGTAFATVFSGDSNREIRRWYISATDSHELPTNPSADASTTESFPPLLAHETSIYALKVDADGDLWTASADKSSKQLIRNRSWAVDTTLTHPDFVRDIIVDEDGGWIVTACRDEHVRVWEKGSGKLFHTFEGHFEEVTGISFLEEEKTIVSVSIDGTIRQWSLKKDDLIKAVQEAAKPESEVDVEKEKPKESGLTEQEEMELAELMGDSD